MPEKGRLPENRMDYFVWISVFISSAVGTCITLLLSGQKGKNAAIEAIVLWGAVQIASVLISNDIDSRKSLLAAVSIAAGCFFMNLVWPVGTKRAVKKGKKRKGKR